uniref:hypothetical protein n=1 Tax=Micromonospora acroterricola TaxID=2202421 RepID=UPI0026C243B5
MSAHLLLSAERGPRECAWALAHLLGRLEGDATRQGLTVQRVHDDLVRGNPTRVERPEPSGHDPTARQRSPRRQGRSGATG